MRLSQRQQMDLSANLIHGQAGERDASPTVAPLAPPLAPGLADQDLVELLRNTISLDT